MKKENRIRKNMEFKRAYRSGKCFWNRNLVLYVKRNGSKTTRLGLSVTKKLGNAVVRNKLRRRIKEITRQNLIKIKDGYDLVVIPKKNSPPLTFKQLESAVLHIYKIAGLFKE